MAVVPADVAIGNRVPVALAVVLAVKKDAMVVVPADGAIGNRVPVALAGINAMKPDARSEVPDNGTIGNRVPVTLAHLVIKSDAMVAVPVDGTIDNRVPVTLAVPPTIKNDTRAPAGPAADGAIGNRVPVTLAAVAIKIDASAVAIGNRHLLDPAVVHVITFQAVPEFVDPAAGYHQVFYQRIRRPVHIDASAWAAPISREGEAHQVDGDAAGLNHNAMSRGMQVGDHVIRAGIGDRVGQARYRRARLDLLQRLHRGCRRAGR